MQKMKLLISLSIICVVTLTIGKTAFADDFGAAMQLAFEEFRKESLNYYQNLENCKPGSYSDNLFVIEGQSGGYCNIKQYMLINNQRYPHLTCKPPMNEVKSYAREKITELNKGGFSYNSATDKLLKYCTQVHNTIHNGDVTISY